MPKNAKFKIILLFALFFSVTINSLQAEPANNNIVIAAGETWGTYTPPNYDYAWPYIGEINESMADVEFGDVNACLFKTDRYASSYYFGNPGWSWMSGKVVYDFTNFLFAIEYNPSDEFATANMLNEGMRYEEKNYAYLTFNHSVPGWDDPSRNYHIPADGGSVLTDDRTLAYGVAAWPTQLGVDVKMTVYSWTTNWNHLDDFHLIEFELKNTGMADMNGDGTVDLTENKIENLVFGYNPGCFHFRIVSDGRRNYYVDNTNFRGAGYDMTPDETGSPMHISFQAIGSQEGTEHAPSISLQNEYWDGYAGYGFLGAKKLKNDAWKEKFLSFRDIHGKQIVPSVGVGSQRGWFSTNQTGFNSVNSGTADRRHTAYMGAFYKDGGKSNDVTMFDLSPNPNLFSSGEFGNPSTFVVKDPSYWQYPDGARERLAPVLAYDKEGKPLGINPIDPTPNKDRPLEPGLVTEGFITQYDFDATPVVGFGPISIDVGETVRVYFVRGSGFRIEGLRKTFKAARAVFKSIGPDGDVTANIPAGPPVPEIKVNVNESVNPLIKWQDPTALGDCDGIKIYRCISLPKYSSLHYLFPSHDTWWKTMNPYSKPDPKPYNPLFTRLDIPQDQQGDSWGPYHLVKVISVNDFSNYLNPDDDSEAYPYAWEDYTVTSAGQSCWYYVSSYKEGAATTIPAEFQGIEDMDITWMESGKVNYNGRSGHWESTWPWTWQHSYYPDENDSQALKNLGAAIILKSNHPEDAAIRISTNSLDFGEARIGDLVKHPDELVIRNAGIADLKIDSIAVPPRFTINKYPRNFPIALTPSPRENNKTETNLIVRFKPLKESDFSGDLIVYHSDNDTTVLTVHLSAKQKETQNTIYESQKWHQFGLAGRSCLLEGNVQNADTLYVSTIEESGYFASYNGGSTWNFQQITRPDSAEIYFNRSLQDASHQLAEKLFFDTINHGCLYYEYIYSTPEKLINKTFRSDDNGITWSQIFKDHENASNIYIYEKIQILVDPNDAQKVYRCLDVLLP